MCGICGMVGVSDEGLGVRMADLLAHRGPDGAGVRAFPAENGSVPATLGHRRLSIIDLTERGAQPMSYAGGRYWITYNGELYNFKELRAELEAEGMPFASDCDTEVVLAMYARHGERMLTRLNGIYAFAIWDTERRELFLARDRLGVKPLYHAQRGEQLYFASEVKALLAALPRPSLNTEALAQYVTFLWVPDPDTMFEGVSKLPPGHYGLFRDGRLQIQQYWDMSFAPESRSETDWIGAVRDGVGEAVRRQMVSDVPLGSFLSGGIDSSAIVAEMLGQTDSVSTYTVGLSAEDLKYDVVPDDLKYARDIGERFGVDYHERILEPDIVSLLPKLVWHMDEPVADPAAIATYLICSAARERLTVILSGMGGDEVFAGYPRHLAARLGRLLDGIPAPIRSVVGKGVERRMTLGKPGRLRAHRRNALKFMRGIEEPWRERYLAHATYYRDDELERLLSPDVRAATTTHPYARHRAYFDSVADEHWLNQILYVDMKTFLPCLNLTYTDKMSMAASTEVRVPLLDDELVELSGGVPPELKMRGLKRKYVLKKSMEGKLPDEVIWRKKAGFTAPLRSWLVNDLAEMVGDVLSPEAVKARGLFDPDEVQRLVHDNATGQADNALRIWTLLTLEQWQQTFTDRDVTSPVAVQP